MTQLVVSGIRKQYRQLQARDERFGMLKNIFSPVYRNVTALDDVSFSIRKGERVALLGQNGAGKSTLVKILCGALSPTTGTVSLDGRVIDRHSYAFKKRLGIVFGQRTQLWWELPITESLLALKTIYEVSDENYITTLKLFEELTGMSRLLKTPAKNLSLGQRTLCEILAACIHLPDILLLDEPTIGLDLEVKDKVRRLINHMNRHFGITVILTSHDTSDIEHICDRILLINAGRLIFDNSVHRFISEHGVFYTLKVTTQHDIDCGQIGVHLVHEGIVGFAANPENTRGCEITFDKTKIEPMTMVKKVGSLFAIDEFHIQGASLESAIKYAYSKHAVS
ncbi:MAG TPA: ATP-binding cassette domain-containing protein [Steroidobacteraceae bacterium]|nr:ATP-binding cassette domain-containing protein [Steroidobacteraceae bacterium]